MAEMTLKPGWSRVKFGDVVRQVKDKADPESSGLERYVAGEHMDTDDLRIRRSGEIGSGYLGPAFHIRFLPGHVLYGSRRTYLRKVAVADFEGICANTTFVLTPKDPNVLAPGLLPFLMQTEAFNAFSIKNSKGSVNPYINFSDLADFVFALPPMEEQRRILEFLQAIEITRIAHANAIDSAIIARTAFVENILFETYDQSRVTTLGAYLLDLSYGSSSRSSYEETGYPILRIPNVLRGHVDYSDLQHIELTDAEYGRLALHIGDVLIVRTNGNPNYVGRSVVIDNLKQKTVYASYLIRIRSDINILRPAFLAEFLNAPSTRQRLRGEVRSSAGNYNLNIVGIRKQPICLPDLTKQDEVVSVLADMDSAQKQIEFRLETTRALKTQALAEIWGGS